MEFVKLFPTLLLGDVLNKITPEQIDSYKTYLSSVQYLDLKKNGKSSLDQHVLDNSIFSSLKNNIFEYSFKYLKKLNHVVEDLQICNSWSNILNKDEVIYYHKHSNSYLSGVFYLDNRSSPITFRNPSSFSKYGWAPEFSPPETSDNMSVIPKKGLLLLFPSWLEHSVLTSQEDNKISIAFNIIPKGKFGPNTGRINL
tara:strand:+ start:54 stop:647 length:594 start_codon:yes stop_codon:yes gene_type:complete